MKLKKYDGNSVNNIVLDTNVLVSGIINPYGSPAKILNLILNGNLIINADKMCSMMESAINEMPGGRRAQAIKYRNLMMGKGIC